jgi:hypothetical protein
MDDGVRLCCDAVTCEYPLLRDDVLALLYVEISRWIGLNGYRMDIL